MNSLRLLSMLVFAGALVAVAGCQKNQPPPRHAEQPQDTSAEQALTTEQLEGVQQTVKAGMNALSSRCYQAELERRGDNVRINAVLRILVSQQGSAEQVELKDPSVQSTEFEQCVDTVVKRWDFPRLARDAWFTYPLAFSPEY